MFQDVECGPLEPGIGSPQFNEGNPFFPSFDNHLFAFCMNRSCTLSSEKRVVVDVYLDVFVGPLDDVESLLISSKEDSAFL